MAGIQDFLVTGDDEAAVEYVREKVLPLLMEGEDVLAVAVQTRLARWWFLPPDGVVVTNHRVLFPRCGILSFKFDDFHWEHVEDVHVESSVFGSTISVTARKSKSGYARTAEMGPRVSKSVAKLVQSQANQVYSVGQRMEHEWREKNRQRLIEETRAERGTVVVRE